MAESAAAAAEGDHDKGIDVTSIFVDGNLAVYGGANHDKIWLLNLSDHVWREVHTHGDVPSARRHHSVCTYRDRMMVYGGDPLDPDTPPDDDPLYAIDVATGKWTQVITGGDKPGERSHHTSVVVDNLLIVFGGRSLNAHPTQQALEEDKRKGFYDVFVLELQKMMWHRVERYDPSAPMLWGHGASTFRHYMIVTGGFDVSAAPVGSVLADLSAPPDTTLSEVVHVWDIDRCEWKKATPNEGLREAPLPRAMHVSQTFCAQVLVYGGITIDSQTNRATNVLDAWVWDIPTGTWHPFPFAVNYWSGRKPLSAVLPGSRTVAVANNQTELHYFDFMKGSEGWITVPCDPARLYLPPPPPQPQRPNPPPPALPQPPPPQPVALLPPAPVLPPPPPTYEVPELTRVAPPPDPREAERERLRAQLEAEALAEKERRMRGLHEQIGVLKGQLGNLATIQGDINLPKRDPDHPSISPPRDHPVAVRPATLQDIDAVDASAFHVHALQGHLGELQHKQREAMEAAFARHRTELEEAKRLHQERLAEVVHQQEEQLEAQNLISKRQMESEKAQLLQNQLELLRKQQRALAEATKVTYPVQPQPHPADQEEDDAPPRAVTMMATAIEKLKRSTSRPFPGQIHALPIDAGVPREVREIKTAIGRLRETTDAAPPPGRGASPRPPTQEEVRNAHMQGLRSHIEAINRQSAIQGAAGTGTSLTKQLSPPRLRTLETQQSPVKPLRSHFM